MNLEKLSARKLHEEIEKRSARQSALLSKVIAAGFGETRLSDLRKLAEDPNSEHHALLVPYFTAFDREHEAHAELAARRRWHGEDKPIKRAS